MRDGADRLACMGCRCAILWVVEHNHRARAFYRDLGGIEGPPEPHAIAPGCAVSQVPIPWERICDIATAALRRLAAI